VAFGPLGIKFEGKVFFAYAQGGQQSFGGQ
jgi:hypothetical protein